MGVLLMLMTIGGVIAAVIVAIIALVTKKSWLLKFTFAAVGVWFLFYTVMLVGFSAASTERELEINEPKEYCGFYLDCHLHAEVTGVRTAKEIAGVTAKGLFYIANVKVFSNARNPNITFRLITPDAVVVDANGDHYVRDEQAESRLPTAGVNLGGDIRPRDTIEKEIVFDLPQGVPNPRLDIREGYGIDHAIEAVLVDDEDSILHKRNYFKLREQTETAGVK
jgi:hypothetical protein